MDEQGGAGGIPHQDEQAQAMQHTPHADRHGEDKTAEKKTAAADTDEASRMDRPQQPEKPDGKGTRWTGPRDQ